MSRQSPRYICYLRNPEQHTNAYSTHAGWGFSPEEARYYAAYYNNQWPFVTTCAFTKAPQWAQDEALGPTDVAPCATCGRTHLVKLVAPCIDSNGDPRPLTFAEQGSALELKKEFT